MTCGGKREIDPAEVRREPVDQITFETSRTRPSSITG